MLARVLNEIKLLRLLLESVGLSANKYATRCILDIKDLSEYFASDTLVIRMNDKCVGNCSVYALADGSVAILTTLDATAIPEEIVNQLLLLGFNYNSIYLNIWLTYRVIVGDSENDNSTNRESAE